MSSSAALAGAFQRLEARPSVDVGLDDTSWDDQWPNWDDLGGDDKGWGDVSD